MCKIGCNWSKNLSNLIQKKQVEIDYIKNGAFRDFEEQFETMRSLKPILLHGLGYDEHSGMRDIGMVDFQRANKLIKRCDSPHYGLHLSIKNADISSYLSDEDIYKHMSKQIQIFKRNLSVPFLLENIPDSPEERTVFDHYPYAEPDKISKLLIDNDVNLLLDLSHARITTIYRNWDIYDFLKNIPLHRIKEIHVNGSAIDKQGFPVDTHEAMREEDYELLSWILEYSSPDIVTLEYQGVCSESPELISENLYNQLKKLNHLCRH